MTAYLGPGGGEAAPRTSLTKKSDKTGGSFSGVTEKRGQKRHAVKGIISWPKPEGRGKNFF